MQDKVRNGDEKMKRVLKEKKEHIQMVKNDSAQLLEIAKQEVQRKYGFEIKQLKRNVIHLKNRLIEQIDERAAQFEKLHKIHQLERVELLNQIRALENKNPQRAKQLAS